MTLVLVLVLVVSAACTGERANTTDASDSGRVVDDASAGSSAPTPDTAPPAVVDAGWPELPYAGHIFHGPSYPRWQPMHCADGTPCPAGQECFRLTQELAICDAAEPTQPTACEAEPHPEIPGDDCGCPGASCGPEQRCVASQAFCSCAPWSVNRCADAPCGSPADCPDGSVCRPTSFIFVSVDDRAKHFGSGRCMRAACRADADCTLVPHGRCGVSIHYPLQSGQTYLSGPSCFYAMRDGECPAGTSSQGMLSGQSVCSVP
jgi:hypothetical protein